MKIKLSQLRKLIKEEVKMLLEYEQSIVRYGDELYLVDDEGNEEFYDKVDGTEYEHLRDGESVPFQMDNGRYY